MCIVQYGGWEIYRWRARSEQRYFAFRRIPLLFLYVRVYGDGLHAYNISDRYTVMINIAEKIKRNMTVRLNIEVSGFHVEWRRISFGYRYDIIDLALLAKQAFKQFPELTNSSTFSPVTNKRLFPIIRSNVEKIRNRISGAPTTTTMTEKGKSAEDRGRQHSNSETKYKKSKSREERQSVYICMMVYLVAVCSFDVTAG